MKIQTYNSGNYIQNNSASFCSKNTVNPNGKKNFFKKCACYGAGALLLAGGISDNSSAIRSEFSDKNGITVQYTRVENNIHKHLMQPVYALKSTLTPENDFLKGVKFDIADSFKNFDDGEAFKKYVKQFESDPNYRGTSFYADGLPKNVAVQESGFYAFNDAEKLSAMRQTVMHEVGHHFDNYFGHEHKADYVTKWDSILYSHNIKGDLYNFQLHKPEDKIIEKNYYSQNSLSDSKAFKIALFKDINLLHKNNDLPKDIGYYVKEGQITNGVTLKDIDRLDGQRAEIYANLFSYIAGEDDGQKEKFLKSFSNSSKVVKKDIKKFLPYFKI